MQAMELLSKLQRNLQEEQKLIVQRMIVDHQCTLRPRQVRSLATLWCSCSPVAEQALDAVSHVVRLHGRH